ncbi:hypothetical protein E1I18_00320 [Mycoplasmopsis mucosicanis]|uniref:Uncharacterized protein n=1 Tax=Mycoplasmopsis mucosicanis TaxID=458208 RepID=A0A507SQZ7_9BACT|nr:hypothetical protein [Mycoplasmopsis mucosicanis]TQC54207.1 hypothetical protein E1I18_00320 [Mycoplasmopsis mucosicanis]
MATWIILIVVVALLVIFFVYSFIKERIKKKKRRIKQMEFMNKADEVKKMTIIELSLLLKKNEELLNNFVPSVGEYKMKEVVQSARQYLLDKHNQPDFKEYIINNVEQKELYKYFALLKDERCTLWKSFTEVYKYIDEQIHLIDEKLDEKLFIEAQKNIEEFYADKMKRH